MMKPAKRGSDTRQAITKYHSRAIYMSWQSTFFFIYLGTRNFILFFSFSGLSMFSFLVGY
jgi:hypothetical protein